MTIAAEGNPSAPVLDGEVHHLDPKSRIDNVFDWAVLIGIVVVVATVVAAFAAPRAIVAVLLVGAALLAVAALGAQLLWKRFTWRAGSEALEIHHGVLTRRSSFVPYHRIQQIDLRQRPIQRALGISTLILRSASATTDAELPGLPTSDADALRGELLARAGIDDAV